MSDIYLLPEEILTQILVKLPVNSIIRSMSVCKQWQSLIRSPFFISTHLSNTTQTQDFFKDYDIEERRDLFSLIPKGGPLVINSEFEFPSFESQIGHSRIVGSCDGLVCLTHYYRRHLVPNSQRIIIWNPATRNHEVLPQAELVIHKYEHLHEFVLGFGVANNVYKVVRLVYSNFYSNELQGEIFCLGGAGGWRKLTGLDDVRLRHRGEVDRLLCPVFFKGFVHWICEKREHNSILRFHVGDEVFDEAMLPPELEMVTPGKNSSLSIMGESLGAIKYNAVRFVGDPIMCDVWIMKDYGVKESWTKLYSIDNESSGRVIGFRGSDEVVVALHEELVTYNPETKGFKHVKVSTVIPHTFYHLVDYKESLVLLGGYKGGSSE